MEENRPAHPEPLGQGHALPFTALHSPRSERLHDAAGSASRGRGRASLEVASLHLGDALATPPAAKTSVSGSPASFLPLLIRLAVVYSGQLGEAESEASTGFNPGLELEVCILVKPHVQPDLGVSGLDRWVARCILQGHIFFVTHFLMTTSFSCHETHR